VAATGPGQGNSRKSMVSVRLAPEEEAALKDEAAANGETLSEYIRGLLLRRSDAVAGAVDFRLYPVSSTVAAAGLAIEAADGALVPRTTQPYVSTLVPH
jgi:Mobilization protein NikA